MTVDIMFNLIDNVTGRIGGINNRVNTVNKNTSNAVNAFRNASKSLGDLGTKLAEGSSKIAESGRRFAEISDLINSRSDNMAEKLEALRQKWGTAGDAVNGATNKMKNGNNIIEQTDRKAKKSAKSVDTLKKAISRLGGAYLALRGAKALVNASDTYNSDMARLSNINDGKQSNEDLYKMITASANNVGASSSTMAGMVAKLGNTGKFGSNEESLAFVDLLSKSLANSGNSQNMDSVMLQLTQAMNSGLLQGEEYNSLVENISGFGQMLAKEMNVPQEQLKKLASEGKITANVLKNAIYNNATEINEKFANMPTTFGKVGQQIKNSFTLAFAGVFEKLTAFLSSDTGQAFIQSMMTGISILGAVFSGLVTIVGGVLKLVHGIFKVVKFLLPFITFVFSTILIYLAITKASMIANFAIQTAQLIKTSAIWLIEHAKMFIASLSVNWPLMAIIATILAIIVVLVKMGNGFELVFGFIGGLIGGCIGYIVNCFKYFYNIIAIVVNFLAGCFQDPVASVKLLFLDLCKNVLGFVEKMASAIETLLNKIPFVEVNITGSITKLKEGIEAKADEIRDESGLKKVMEELEFSNIEDFASKGYQMGAKLGSLVDGGIAKVGEMIGGFTDKLTGSTDVSGYGLDYSNMDLGTDSNPVAVTGTEKDGAMKVDIADQDLRYLRDIAHKEFTMKFATLAPNINLSVAKSLDSKTDLDALGSAIGKILEEQIAIASEG